MQTPGLVETPAVLPPAKAVGLQLFLDDTLASARRLWIRGRIIADDDSFKPPAPTLRRRRWWSRSQPAPETAQSTLHIATRVSGLELKADVPVQADGRFDITHEARLPTARRGWRVARHRIELNGQSVERCNVVLGPSEDTERVRVVVLPLAYTHTPHGLQRLANPGAADADLERFTQTLSGLDPLPVFYVAICPLELSPEETDAYHAELALALASLRWPAGNIIRVAASTEAAPAAILSSLDRLRWLFAGSCELELVNSEPRLAVALPPLEEPAGDRARCHIVLADSSNGTHTPGLLLTTRRRASRSNLLPRGPIVFCHGMLAFSMIKMHRPEDTNSFTNLREFLAGRGFRALFPQVEPTGGVAARAQQLKEQILRWTDEPVNIIAHSMGGLDARHLISRLDMASHVRSLTTISTPHRGTYLADWFMVNYRQRVPLLLALEALGVNVDGFRDCTREACRAFNEVTPDHPRVRYFSYAGEVTSAHLAPPLRRAWSLLTPIEGPNDGMVSVTSARWGEYLGTVRADHFAQTPDAVFLRANEDFDALGFYTRVVEDLARRGF
ncbi:MAG: esterase/lipase family protein [Gemmataceae bacterium]